jgi:hypothetical protein
LSVPMSAANGRYKSKKEAKKNEQHEPCQGVHVDSRASDKLTAIRFSGAIRP